MYIILVTISPFMYMSYSSFYFLFVYHLHDQCQKKRTSKYYLLCGLDKGLTKGK